MTTTGTERFKGGWALVTGAAREEGLGYAFARKLAGQGINLLLVDILADDLAQRAAELRRDFGVEARTVVCDLGQPAPYAPLEDAVKDLAVDILICNHMFTPKDTPKILDMPLGTHNRILDINARGYLNLIHRFATDMRARGRGAIIIVASGAGLTSAPYTAAYSANKAFQIAFGEALWYELKGSGVDVLVMIGGLMRTQGDALDSYPHWLIAEPTDVVDEVLPAVGRQHMIVPGRVNRAFVWFQTRVLSRRKTVEQIGRFMETGLGKK